MTDTAAYKQYTHRTARLRSFGWQCDYAICTCARGGDECPHCGVSFSDAHHRGQCHARSLS